MRLRCGSSTNTTWRSSIAQLRPPVDVARKNPGDPQATQFVLAAYQSKIDLMNQIAKREFLRDSR